MAKKPFDVKERERLRFAYLKALYEKEQSEKTSLGTIIAMDMTEAVTLLQITEVQFERVITDLESAGLIQATGGLFYSLTELGREMIENHLHELHRPWHHKLRENLGSPAIVGGLAGFITSLIVNVLSASDMPWWVKLLLGKK